MTERLTGFDAGCPATLCHSLAEEQNDPALLIGAYNNALAGTLYFIGDFEAALRYAQRGVRMWRSQSVESQVQEVGASAVSVLCYEGQAKWHLGDIVCFAKYSGRSGLTGQRDE